MHQDLPLFDLLDLDFEKEADLPFFFPEPDIEELEDFCLDFDLAINHSV